MIKDHHQLVELVRSYRNCISPQDRHNSHQFHIDKCEFRPYYFRPRNIAHFRFYRSTRRKVCQIEKGRNNNHTGKKYKIVMIFI